MNAQTKDIVTKVILHEMGAIPPEESLTPEQAKELQAELLSSDEIIISYLQTRQLMEDFALHLHKEIAETRIAWLQNGVNKYGFAWPIQLVRDRSKEKLVLDMLPQIVKSRDIKKKKPLAKDLEVLADETGSSIAEDSSEAEVSLILPATPTDLEIKLDVELNVKNIKAGFELSHASQPVEITLFEYNGNGSVPIANVMGTELEDIQLPFNRRYSVKIEEHGIAAFDFLLHLEEISGKTI